MSQSNAQRQAKHRAKRKAAGYKTICVELSPEGARSLALISKRNRCTQAQAIEISLACVRGMPPYQYFDVPEI